MDTNEKDILNEENLEETVNDIAEPEVQETQETADVDTQDTEYSTIEISQSDIDDELLKYGALTDDSDPDEFSQEYSEELEDAQPEKKKLIQKPTTGFGSSVPGLLISQPVAKNNNTDSNV